MTSAEAVHFPPLLPSHPVRAADWRAFVGRWLALPYADVGSADLPAWRAFLAARYPSVATMNGAHGRPAAGPPASFAAVTLPAAIPEGRVELNDWMGFVSLALPIRRHAHRFTVLVPATPGEDAAAREARLAEVRAVVERERPAHASFEVKPYRACFASALPPRARRVLGRQPYAAIVLAAGYLGEGYLGGVPPLGTCAAAGWWAATPSSPREAPRHERLHHRLRCHQPGSLQTGALRPGAGPGGRGLRQEELYLLGRDRLHNRALHGYGTVCG